MIFIKLNKINICKTSLWSLPTRNKLEMKKACETLRSFLLISAYENQADLTNLWEEKFRKDKASGKSRILKVFRLFSFSLTVFETHYI